MYACLDVANRLLDTFVTRELAEESWQLTYPGCRIEGATVFEAHNVQVGKIWCVAPSEQAHEL